MSQPDDNAAAKLRDLQTRLAALRHEASNVRKEIEAIVASLGDRADVPGKLPSETTSGDVPAERDELLTSIANEYAAEVEALCDWLTKDIYDCLSQEAKLEIVTMSTELIDAGFHLGQRAQQHGLTLDDIGPR